jgi:peroxiredoxin
MSFSPWIAGALVAGALESAEVDESAPDFNAESTMGKVSLKELRGKRAVVLAFYLKDFTGG